MKVRINNTDLDMSWEDLKKMPQCTCVAGHPLLRIKRIRTLWCTCKTSALFAIENYFRHYNMCYGGPLADYFTMDLYIKNKLIAVKESFKDIL